MQHLAILRLQDHREGTASSIGWGSALWETVEDDQANIAWAQGAWRDLRHFSTGGTYINFLTQDEGDERIHAAYGKNYDRLVEVKTTWAPGNLFRTNKNIAPRES